VILCWDLFSYSSTKEMFFSEISYLILIPQTKYTLRKVSIFIVAHCFTPTLSSFLNLSFATSHLLALAAVGGQSLHCGQVRGCKIIQKEKPLKFQVVIFMKWWRRRESNPRPQALCHWLYMLIPTLI